MKENKLDIDKVIFNFIKDFEAQLYTDSNLVSTNSEKNEYEINSTFVLNISNFENDLLFHVSYSDHLNFHSWFELLALRKRTNGYSSIYAITARSFTDKEVALAKKLEIGLHEIDSVNQKIEVVYFHGIPIILTQTISNGKVSWNASVSFKKGDVHGVIYFTAHTGPDGKPKIKNRVISNDPEKFRISFESEPKKVIKNANSKCYAQHLGDCNNISREHLISRSVLEIFNEKELRVIGLPNVPDNILLSTNNIIKKILCENHNSHLSKIDNFGKTFFQALYGSIDARVKPFEGSCVINGNNINLWLLKVACGAVSSYKDQPNRLPVPKEWIDVLFEVKPWPEYFNSYWEIREDKRKEQIGFGVDLNWDSVSGRCKGINFKSPLLSIVLSLGDFKGVPGILKPYKFDAIDKEGKVTEILIDW